MEQNVKPARCGVAREIGAVNFEENEETRRYFTAAAARAARDARIITVLIFIKALHAAGRPKESQILLPGKQFNSSSICLPVNNFV